MAGLGGREKQVGDDSEFAEAGAFTEINIVPLVDIMLVLLVILMATSTAMLESSQGQGFRVSLPTGTESDEVASLSGELVVAILEDGRIIVGGDSVSLNELKEIFDREVLLNSDRVVLVQADESALHRRVVQVMELARSAGLSQLAIATQPQ
jgi:biopolymer transport protein ExbD